MRSILSFLGLCILMGCLVTPEADVRAGLGEEFTLKLNQTAYLQDAGFLILFSEVEQDSRCPSDVTCVWEGVAMIEVKGRYPGESGPFMDVTVSTQKREADFTGKDAHYTIELVGLSPYPNSTGPIQPGEYAATLEVTER